jgi:hypothetical protein
MEPAVLLTPQLTRSRAATSTPATPTTSYQQAPAKKTITTSKPFSQAMKLHRIFTELNASQSGVLPWHELRELAARHGDEMSEDTYEGLCAAVGVDPTVGFGELELLELFRMMDVEVDEEFGALCQLSDGVMATADRDLPSAMKALRRIPALAALEAVALRQLVAELDLIDFAAGAAILREGGTLNSGMHMLQHGAAVATRGGQVAMHYTAGSFFGEVALLRPHSDGARPFSVTATAATRCLRLSRAQFHRVCPAAGATEAASGGATAADGTCSGGGGGGGDLDQLKAPELSRLASARAGLRDGTVTPEMAGRATGDGGIWEAYLENVGNQVAATAANVQQAMVDAEAAVQHAAQIKLEMKLLANVEAGEAGADGPGGSPARLRDTRWHSDWDDVSDDTNSDDEGHGVNDRRPGAASRGRASGCGADFDVAEHDEYEVEDEPRSWWQLMDNLGAWCTCSASEALSDAATKDSLM